MKKPVILMLIALILFSIVVCCVLIYRTQSDRHRIDLQSKDTETAFSSGKLDINRATQEQLMALPGIGETIAKRIISYRKTNGPFTRIEQLQNIKGVTESRFKAVKEYVTVIVP